MMRFFCWILVVALMVSACGPGFRPETYASPIELLAASEALWEQGRCGDAIPGFQRVLVQLPTRDPNAADARFFLGECRFRDGDFLEAAREFRRVADEFPDHDRGPQALLRAGESYSRLWRRPELDPTYGESALAVFRELLGRYPESAAAERARDQAARLMDMFAQKDYQNGTFYLRHGAYDSAIIYFRSVVANQPSSQWAPRALIRLVEIYRRLNYREEMTETCANLRRFHPSEPGLEEACPAVPAD